MFQKAIFLPTLLVSLAGLTCVHAQEDLRVLDAKDAPRKMLYTYLLGEAQKHFDARRAVIAGLKTPEDLQKRQQYLKTKFIEALGGFPEKTPLNAQVVGKEQRDGYRIEKIIFESRPNHHVTATLYLPDGKGPFPGVLMPIGHSNNGKAAEYIQRGSILLAKNGIAVLPYDPIGQGERRQLLDKMGKPAIGNSTTEHTLVGVGALLVGRSTASYRIWDGIRSLDYLASRPEIDAKRLGCTGCSGGGTLTSYLMALDDRIVAAAPSCYITSLERLFATIGPQDAEQNITGQVAFGMEHADYITMRAPRPTLLATATRDFFDIQGSWTTFREATLLFGLLGHSERVSLVEYNTGHGYPKPQREAVTRWMRRWLLNVDDSPVEELFAIAKDQDLQCTRSGQVLEDFKGKSVFHLNLERAEDLARIRKDAKRPREEVLKEVRRLLAVPEGVSLPRKVMVGDRIARKGYTITKWLLETEPGVKVPMLVFRPDGSGKDLGVVVYVHGQGMAAEAGPGGELERYALAGNEVLALDVRGLGETAPGTVKGPSNFGPDFKESFLALHLNRPLLGQRVYDLLTVLAMVRELNSKVKSKAPVHVVGVGTAGPIALHAAALEPSIDRVTLRDSVVSWHAVVQAPITYQQLTNVVPGALAIYDLPDLAALLAPRPLTLHKLVSPKQETLSRDAVADVYAAARTAYEGLGKAKDLHID